MKLKQLFLTAFSGVIVASAGTTLVTTSNNVSTKQGVNNIKVTSYTLPSSEFTISVNHQFTQKWDALYKASISPLHLNFTKDVTKDLETFPVSQKIEGYSYAALANTINLIWQKDKVVSFDKRKGVNIFIHWHYNSWFESNITSQK